MKKILPVTNIHNQSNIELYRMNNHPKKLTIILQCDSERQAQVIAHSLSPELQHDQEEIQITLAQKKQDIVFEFSAAHTNILRASMNSYLRWIETAYKVSCVDQDC